MYKDIKINPIDDKCTICHKKLEGGDSPWSICYDPAWKTNSYGGDGHKYRGLLCQECAEELLDRLRIEYNNEWFCLDCFTWNRDEETECAFCGASRYSYKRTDRTK